MELKNPKYVKTAINPKDYPKLDLPEIAIVGRSNVGKSSLLNHLFRRKNLVKTSSTPGKTQAINFFSTDKIVFVDLPGYGFASVPLKVRKQWGPMVQTYFEEREEMRGVLFLFDIRRTPNNEDRQVLEWAKYYEIPLVLVLTKVDKVSRNEREKQKKKILVAFGEDDLNHTFYSVPKKIGRNELLSKIREVMSWDE